MVVLFFFELMALLIFFKLADLKRFRELLPIVFTGVYLRFLDHYILIDWLELWHIHGTLNSVLWLPMSADLTIWPVVTYLFIQYLPKIKVWIYILSWSVLMYVYVRVLFWIDLYSAKKGWLPIYSAFFMLSYFSLLFLFWKWLRKPYTIKKTSRS